MEYIPLSKRQGLFLIQSYGIIQNLIHKSFENNLLLSNIIRFIEFLMELFC